ncbi:MCE family protein [Nocardioides marmoraquaticus]
MNALARARRGGVKAVVGAVVGALALTGCSVYDAPLPGGPDAGDDPITVTARFRDVLDLVPNSTVKLDDVNVGKVTAVSLDGYVAEVEMSIRRDAKIPANTAAQLRQTSLLGEKFVSLEEPSDPSSDLLADDAVIGLDRTGRNPEIEEVFGALALLLNGGGVGQLKSITEELNLALDGRSGDVRSVLRQISTFVGTLDDNRATIVAALENTNRLAREARAQQGTIENALDDVPAALRSLNRQRDDLVRLLRSLDRLSGIGTRVIRESKQATINSLRDLGPVLRNLADAGQDVPDSINVILTYPFIDEAVGRDPQVARQFRQGDYTNLSVDLDLDLADLPIGPIEIDNPLAPLCPTVDQLLDTTRANVTRGVDRAVAALPDTPLISKREQQRLATVLTRRILRDVVQAVKDNCEVIDVTDVIERAGALLPDVLDLLGILTPPQVQDLLDGTLGAVGGALGGSGGGSLLGGDGGGGLLGGLTGRAAPAYDDPFQIDPFDLGRRGLDPGIGTLLMQGVATTR